MKTHFTNGEWTEKDGQIYSLETGKTLALIPYWDSEDKEKQANAKLIAAAPEMFNVLQLLTEAYRTDGNYDKHDFAGFIKLAEKAIYEVTE